MKNRLFSIIVIPVTFGILYLATGMVFASFEEPFFDSRQKQIEEDRGVKISTSSLVVAIKELQGMIKSFKTDKTEEEILNVTKEEESVVINGVYTVPFYSQFTDISDPYWQKVGCGIASLAMLIDFYSNDIEDINELLNRGIENGAYLDDAGWIHQELINLVGKYHLSGDSVSLSQFSLDDSFSEFEKVLTGGPVMASVHYTFEPTNPIPHLVVINGVKDGKVFYNDPADKKGGGSLSIEKFKKAWKKRYIKIRPI